MDSANIVSARKIIRLLHSLWSILFRSQLVDKRLMETWHLVVRDVTTTNTPV